MALRLVVGLGNPGDRYAGTRHNVGFMLLDRLAGAAGGWKDFARGLGLWRKEGGLWLAKPSTFMNDSGRFVRAFANFYKINAQDMLICFDEVALELGRVRLRRKGSAGGQKGMKSIIEELGTEEVPRLRIGIGPQPEKMDSADFVLQRFPEQAQTALETALTDAVGAVRVVRESGIDEAMNRYNPAPAADS